MIIQLRSMKRKLDHRVIGKKRLIYFLRDSESNEKLFGIKIESQLNFKDHIGRICTKSQC